MAESKGMKHILTIETYEFGVAWSLAILAAKAGATVKRTGEAPKDEIKIVPFRKRKAEPKILPFRKKGS